MNRHQLLVSGIGHLIGGLIGFAIVLAASLWRPTSWGGWIAVGIIVLAGAEIGSIVATRLVRKKPASAQQALPADAQESSARLRSSWRAAEAPRL